MRPIVYITPANWGRTDDEANAYDVYRCENGSQAWNVAQSISEPTARVIAALLAAELLVKAIAYEEARCAQSTNETLALVADPEQPEFTAAKCTPWIEGYQSSRDDRIAALKARAFTLPADVPVID